MKNLENEMVFMKSESAGEEECDTVWVNRVVSVKHYFETAPRFCTRNDEARRFTFVMENGFIS